MRNYLAFAILVISFFATVPQLQKTISSGSTDDFSEVTLIMNLIINALLAIHAYLTRDVAILAVGVWYFIFWSILTAYKLNIVHI